MSKEKTKQKNFISRVNDYAQRVASEMHMRALRDGFVTSLPFLFIAGIMILINYVILAPDGFLLGKVVDAELLTTIQGFGARLINGSMNIFSLIVIVLIANSIAKSRKLPNAGLAISVIEKYSDYYRINTANLKGIPSDALRVSEIKLPDSAEAFLAQYNLVDPQAEKVKAKAEAERLYWRSDKGQDDMARAFGFDISVSEDDDGFKVFGF